MGRLRGAVAGGGCGGGCGGGLALAPTIAHLLHWNFSVSGGFFFVLQLCTSRTSMGLPNLANYFKLQNSVGAKF